MDNGQAVLTRGSTRTNNYNPPCCVIPLAQRSGVLGKTRTANFSSAGAPTFIGSITERHGDNS